MKSSTSSANGTDTYLDRRIVDAWAKANAEMYCAYIESVAQGARRAKR